MSLYERLLTLIPDQSRVIVNESVIEQHGQSLTYHEWKMPEAVVYPKNKQEVKDIVLFAKENDISITPFGVGSSLEGQVIPQHGGISMDFSLMKAILKIFPDDFIAVVQPGVTREELNLQLKTHGLFFPVDPGVDATLGGMSATNASGTNSVKYGVTRDQVLALEVVLADGRIINTGSKAMKSSSGYSLKDLFIGSEGTLGIFTEITLRLHGIPEHEMAARICFSNLDEAGTAALQILSSGIPLGRLELVDHQTISAVNKYLNFNINEADTLFLECSGSKEEVEQQIEIIKNIATSANCQSFEYESESLARRNLWEARHKAGMAIGAANPGKKLMSTDVCVPISYLPDAIHHAREVAENHQVNASIFGHVGDGNFHVVLAIDPDDPASLETALEINEKIVLHALKSDGTCSGEHGIGTGKKKYLSIEHGKSMDVMQEIKAMFDPQSIFNPGVLFDK